MIKKILYLFIILLSTISATEIYKTNDIKFSNYSTENGLLQSSVRALTQDSRGYLWIGTDGGLQRFNGTKFESFGDGQGGSGLYHSFIRTLYLDTYENLWIVAKGGISLFSYKDSKIRKLFEINGRDLIEYNKKLYLASGAGVYEIDPIKFTLEKINIPKINEELINSIGVYEGKILIGANSGLYIYDLKKKSFEETDIKEKVVKIKVIDSNIFVSTSKQLYTGKKVINLEKVYEAKGKEVFTSIDYFNGQIYLGTTEGLLLFKNESQIYKYESIASDRHSLPNNLILNLFRDKNKVLWIGSSMGGLSKENKIKYLRNFDGYNKNSMKDNNIHAIVLDSENKMWIGHDKGFTIYDRNNKTFKNFLDEEVWAISKDEKNFFVGTKYSGLFVYDLQGKLIKNIKFFSEKDVKRINTIYSHKDFLLIGTYGNGLVKLNKKDYSYEVFSNQNGKLYSDFIWDIEEIDDDTYFVGTEDSGITILNLKNKRYSVLSKKNGDFNENSLWQLKKYKNVMLIGSWNSGLYIYDLYTKKLTNIDTKKGLLDNTIYSIEAYKDKVWVSTDLGIAEIFLKDFTIKNYDINDGLQDNEFNIGASYLNEAQNEVFFGGIKGSSTISLESKKELRDFYIYLDKGYIDFEEFKTVNEVVLSYKNFYLSFDLSVLDFENNEKNRIAYKLEGFDKEYRVSTSKTIQYTRLPPGEYRFIAYGINNAGDKSKNVVITRVVVKTNPLWNWKSKLFYLTVIALLLYSYIRIYIGQKLLKEKLRFEAMEKQRALEAKEYKDIFISNVSHELRTPMQSILSATQVLEDKSYKNTEKYINILSRSTVSLLNIVNDILDITKFDKNIFKLNKEYFNIKNLFLDLSESYSMKAKEKDLNFFSEIYTADDFEIIYSDEVRLKQVLDNLLSNAIKYTREGEVFFSLEIEEDKKDYLLRFIVKDTGIGIEEEMLDKIFDRFERNNADKLRIKGFGLGLNITKKIIEELSGTIKVESMINFGSIFTVEIPVEAEQIVFEEEKIENKKIIARVLLVEDDILIAQMTKEILQNMGLTVEVTLTGKSALDMLKEGYDLLITDLNLSDISGELLLKEVKSKNYSTKTILMTADSRDKIENLGIEADIVLYKPFKIEKIYEKISKLFKNERLDEYKEYLQKLNMKNSDIKKLIQDNYKNMEERLINSRVTGDYEEYRGVLHKLKGSVSFWGNERLEVLIKSLADVNNSMEEFRQIVEEIQKEVERITSNI